jgi:polyisoprenoid-binding protein YceI
MTMKKILVAASVALVSVAAVAFKNFAPATTYKVATDKSKIEWFQGKPDGSYHEGTIKIKSGSVDVTDGKLTGGKFVIDLTSITSENPMLTEHLKDDQHKVLETAKFSEAIFTITKVAYTDAKLASADITGDLDLKGSKTPLTFKAALRKPADNFSGQAYFTLDFTKWGVQLASATQIKINLVATK